MTARELRQMYLDFFKRKGHQVIASASLLPDNDPTVLFTTAGMHPLVPYLLGEAHPLGKRLTDVQKCFRTGDIDEVGDDTHLTFFEMLGNWSLGDYFKQQSISFSYEFLTKELGIPMERLAVTVFEGDQAVPRDEETKQYWMENGLKENQIFFYGREENWWGPAGQTGPCGPDTEIFYDTKKTACGPKCGPSCKCGKYVEIWNNVFMEYKKEADGSYIELEQKNVDTGMGLERMLTFLNGKSNVYETELFLPVIGKLEEYAAVPYQESNKREYRIIAEHMRAMTFLLGDEKRVVPSNNEQGYVLRRLIRRVIRLLSRLGIQENILGILSEVIIRQYGDDYPELKNNENFILEQLQKEYHLFAKTLETGLKRAESAFEKIGEDRILSGDIAFHLYDTYGFPLEFTKELAEEKGIQVDIKGFEEKFKEHQNNSRLGADKKFAGGLSDHSEQTARLHTATHLLQGALRRVLGGTVGQRNCITIVKGFPNKVCYNKGD